MPAYHGRKGTVYMATTGTGTASRMVRLTNWSLDMSTDTVEVTSFGDANKVYVQGLKDVRGTISGWWDDADDSLFDGADSADGVKLYLYPTSDVPTVYFYGPAWLDASIEVAVDGANRITANFVAKDAWSRRP